MMATYFHGGSEIQAGGGGGGDQNLQTLYLMNPNFIAASYSDAQITCTPPNMLFLNPSNNALSQGNLPHAPPPPPPPQQQQFIGLPLGGSHPSDDHGRPSPSSSCSLQHQIPAANLHGLSSASRVHPNLWSPANNPIRPSQSQSGEIPSNGPDVGDPMGFRRPMANQGLSLSLSPGMQMQPNQNQVGPTLAGGSSTNGVIPGSKYLKAAQQLLEEVVNVGGNFNSITNFSNHDKPDSGNNDNNNNGVGDNHRRGDSSGDHKEKAKAASRDQSGVGEGGLSHGGNINVGGESSSGGSLKAAELSTAQRQELQMKKAKLLNMLDEVEQRYRQYNTQMQVVVSSFEQAAGSGSAKLYTSLALKTISKQFRCLKDAILCQIKGTSKSLGEEGSNNANTGVKLEGHQAGAGSGLRFVDHQLRQQRALQQLGMMQHNAWRPQRGLPERAVSVLRAWLFEHFLHPYPKDSDKILLAKQTGLTRSQVSNWFINARVRLWKPMVEEMYLEEIKTTQEQKSGDNSEDNTTTNTWTANNNNNSNNNNNLSRNENFTTKERGVGQQDQKLIMQAAHQQQPPGHSHSHNHTTNDMISNMCATSSQGFIGASSDMESLMGRSPKKQRSNSDIQNDNSPSSILSMDMEMKPVDHHQQRHSFMMTNHHGDHGDADAGTGFNPYMVNDMAGRFNPDQMTYNGNAVSLTLGLPRCDSLSLGNPHQNFIPNQGIPLGRRLDMGGAGDPDFCGNNMAPPSHPTNHAAAYDTIDLQNRKRFAAQILHDFVASQ